MPRSHAFAPVWREDARVLILGTLPGAASLAAGRYYAHPRNGFWRLLGAAVGRDLASLPYAARLQAVTGARVALWDVIASADRRGSLDAAIRLAEPAALAGFVAVLPRLRAIAFNGGTASRLGRRQLGADAAPALIDLPSSSPAYAAMSFEEKRRRWAVIANHLG